MTEMKTIDPQHAADLYELDDGATTGPWIRITEQRLDRGWMLVVQESADISAFWGLWYLTDSGPDLQSGGLPLTRLYPHTVTTVEYRREAA